MQTKFKICSICQDPCRLWIAHPPMCKNCAGLAKLAKKKEHKPLVQTVDDKQAKPFKFIRPVSKKLAAERRRYKVLRDQYINDHQECELRILCNGAPATDLHHVRPRAFFLCDVTVFKAACRACHDRVNVADAEARELGFLKSKHVKAV